MGCAIDDRDVGHGRSGRNDKGLGRSDWNVHQNNLEQVGAAVTTSIRRAGKSRLLASDVSRRWLSSGEKVDEACT